MWLDTSDISTLYQESSKTTPVAADTDPVGAIEDKSGNGNDATALSGDEAVWQDSGFIEFTGTDWLSGSFTTIDNDDFSLYFVFHPTNFVGTQHIMGFTKTGTAASDNFFQWLIQNELSRLQRGDNASNDLRTDTYDAATYEEKQVVSIISSTSSVKLYINGILLSTLTTTKNATIDKYILFNRETGGDNSPGDGNHWAYLFYDGAHSDSDRASVEGYLTAAYPL